mgnify:CR=1 FL=1
MSTPVTTLHLYDTTLRDGMQGQGMSLSAAEKVRVVQALDRLGVHFIEAGFPSSNPKEEELFELLASTELETAAVCAFGMTRRRGVAADEDEALRTLVGSFAPVCTLVGKTWGLHLEKVTRVSREENLAMIVDSVNFCRAGDKRAFVEIEFGMVMVVDEILFRISGSHHEITAVRLFLHVAHVFRAHGEIWRGVDFFFREDRLGGI